MEALIAALSGPSVSVTVNANCCNRTNSNDVLIVSGNTIKPQTCWQKVLCCCSSNRERIKGKDAVKHYFESNYDSDTASKAFHFAQVNFNQINSISAAKYQTIKEHADKLLSEKTKSSPLKKEIEEPEEFKENSEHEEVTKDTLPRQKTELVATLKNTQLLKKITDDDIERIVKDAMHKAILEGQATLNMKKIHLKIKEQLTKDGYVLASNPMSPRGRIPTYEKPSPHHSNK